MTALPPSSPSSPASSHSGIAVPMRWLAGSDARWQVQLLGQVRLHDGHQLIDRFPSRAVAALLARLALQPQRAHGREELMELLWPGVNAAVGRNRLRQALSTLRSLLEPPGHGGPGVLLADRQTVRVVPGTLACDAAQFEHLCQRQPQAAAALYQGDLMPGFYDEWIHDERQRLAALWEALPLRDEDGPDLTPQRTYGPGEIHTRSDTRVDPGVSLATVRAATAATPATVATTTLIALPSYLTRLFGVEQAASNLRDAVLAHRMVTLVGAGGSGKTRLAVEVAQQLQSRFERVVFVPLVSCETLAQAQESLARALQLPAAASNDATALLRLAQALVGAPVLLVLDNFEQLVPVAQGWVAELLAAAPALHVLVTSRAVLNLDGEVALPAQALAMPLAGADFNAAAQSPAVNLFIDRARSARADFHLTTRNVHAIVALVQVLHGMPLAIELAATRVRSFAPAELLALLSGITGGHGDSAMAAAGSKPAAAYGQRAATQRPALDRPPTQLALLTRAGPRSGNDPRHASMAAVIDWSWRLLDAEAQAVMAVLTIFPGDASTAAIAAAAGLPVAQISALLDSLVSQSMVRLLAPSATNTRFALLEPVREYAAQQTTTAALRAAERALRRWFIFWVQGLHVADLPSRIAPELATLYMLLSRWDRHPDPCNAPESNAPVADAQVPHAALEEARDILSLALALRAYWDTDAVPGAVQAALEQALAQIPASENGLRADAHEMLAYLRFEAGFVVSAQTHAEAAVAAAPPGSEPARRARALVRRAWVHLAASHGFQDQRQGSDRVAAALDEALALARSCGDREVQARALHQQSVLLNHTSDNAALTEALLAQSQALWQALGDRRKAFARLRNRAQCWVHMGRIAQAKACFEQCEQAALEEGDWVGQIDSQLSLATLLENQRQWAAALTVNRRCVALCWQRWHRHGLGFALWNPARPLARMRQPESAMRLLGFAATYWTTQFGPLCGADERYVRRVKALVVAQVGATQAQSLWSEGSTMNLAAAVALALEAG